MGIYKSLCRFSAKS